MYLSVSAHLRMNDKVEARKVDGSIIQAADYYTLKLETMDNEVVIYMTPEGVQRVLAALNNAVVEGVTV